MLDAISPPYRGRYPGHSERKSPVHGSMATPLKTPPIQIPQKRRPVVPVSVQAISPEMIFEMSPITSDFPPASISSGHDSSRNDSFVYSIPVFSSPKIKDSRPRHSPLSFVGHDSLDCDISPEEVVNFSTAAKHPTRTSRRGRCALDEQDLIPDTPHRKPSTTKITGFLPIKGERPDAHLQENRPLQRLSPGPRRSSYSSSPWILPGKGSNSDEGLGSSLADTSPFEFERSLLRRIENQNRPRFAGLRTYPM